MKNFATLLLAVATVVLSWVSIQEHRTAEYWRKQYDLEKATVKSDDAWYNSLESTRNQRMKEGEAIADVIEADSTIAAHGGHMCWERLQNGKIDIQPCRTIIRKYSPETYRRITKRGGFIEAPKAK